MPSIRHTDRGPAARNCTSCSTTHRPHIACPPANWWLITGTPFVPAKSARADADT